MPRILSTANAPDQARLQPSPEAGCSPFQYIPDWQKKALVCADCHTRASVKYRRKSDGRPVCNLCVANRGICLKTEAYQRDDKRRGEAKHG